MKAGDHVIVETARGIEYGRVVLEPKEVGEDEVVHPLKKFSVWLRRKMTKEKSRTGSGRRMLLRSARKDPRAWSGNETDRCGIYL